VDSYDKRVDKDDGKAICRLRRTKMSTQNTKPKKKLLPNPATRQSFDKALKATNKQYAKTLARLAK
jgi:hypothetical protein